MGISKEDLIGGVIYGQSIGPLQLGCDNGADIAPVHANPPDIRCVTPVGPVQPSGLRDDRKKKEGGGVYYVLLIKKNTFLFWKTEENIGFALLQLKALSVCVCVLIPIFRINSHGTRSADGICGISICETFRQQLLLVPPV